jgi:hypothetical protein
MEYPNHKMSCKIPVEEWRLPTAETLLESYRFKAGEHIGNSDYNLMCKFAIEFAKLHCEAQLKSILEKAKVKKTVTSGGIRSIKHVVDKDSILTAYPLDKII